MRNILDEQGTNLNKTDNENSLFVTDNINSDEYATFSVNQTKSIKILDENANFITNETDSNKTTDVKSSLSFFDLAENAIEDDYCIAFNIDWHKINHKYWKTVQQISGCLEKTDKFKLLRRCLEGRGKVTEFARRWINVYPVNSGHCRYDADLKFDQSICVVRTLKTDTNLKNGDLCSIMARKDYNLTEATTVEVLLEYVKRHCGELFKNEHLYTYDAYTGSSCLFNKLAGLDEVVETVNTVTKIYLGEFPKHILKKIYC